MRYLKLIILLSISSCTFAQTIHYFNVGQLALSGQNNCLVIKNNSKGLKKLSTSLKLPESISAIKLVGFNEQNYSLDSLMKGLKSLTSLTYIIFENCDLSALDSSLSNFKNLEKIAILKQSTYYENAFFPLLKDNKIKELSIQTNDPEIIKDSLHLLAHIKSIQIGSDALFNKSNYTTTIQFNNQNTIQTVEIAYFGDFYKPNPTGVRENKPVHKTQPEAIGYQSKLDCIRQPIPGIDINDTTYTFNPSEKAHFTYESGTRLMIDANAFFNQNDTPYNGTVTLFYREFRNPVEIMLSGIPMTNTENGKTQVFKSGGMYEINAFDTQNRPLKLNSDTAIKINFALTDTSSSFKFYSLNNKGWDTESDNITITKPDTTSGFVASKAVREYYNFLNSVIKNKADTLNYMSRFYSNDYLFIYRKDNFPQDEKHKNLKDTSYTKVDGYKKKTKTKALFRVKYLRQTKDKEIVFTIVPARKTTVVPEYISVLFNKNYLYNGNLSKEEFKAQYSRKLLCWDLRTTTNDNTINLDIKTNKTHYDLSGQIITLRDNKTYVIQKRSGKILNQKVARLIKRDAKEFNKTDRLKYGNLNDANHKKLNNRDEMAYKHCQPFQNNAEKKYSYNEWETYAKAMYNRYSLSNSTMVYSEMGNTLLKSGMGIKNIDCYIHNGSMQDIYVKYNNTSFDSIVGQYSTILFKSINTNFPLAADYTEQSLSGYYFKNRPNYIIRFANNQIMQVTKPHDTEKHKTSNTIILDYTDQFNVKGLNSDAITKLILD